MRPLKLTMSAFGPYAGGETIDFKNLNDKNIFLITGPTGAGKTTIFDAISYAVFGEASGSSRDKDTLRSDFALSETPTYVELEFELRGKEYKITRFPQQERKKVRGEGFIFKNADAELILPNGDIVTKVNKVDEKVSEILGINKNQFRQIVMLPQGEFRKLLEAESKEREVIFRKIFGTEAFEIIQRKLDDQKKSLYRKIADTKTQRDTHVKHIDPGNDELLIKLINAEDLNIIEIINKTIEFINKDEEESKNLKEEIQKLKDQQIKFQKNIVEGEEINKKLKEKYELEEKLNSHLSKKKVYEEKQIRLDKGRKTIEIKLVEDSLIDRQHNLKLKQSQYKESEQKLKVAVENLFLCKSKLEQEEAKEGSRKKLSDDIATLKNSEEKVKEYEQKSSQIHKLRKELKNKEECLKKLKLSINTDKDKLETISKTLVEAQEAETQKEKGDRAVNEKEFLISELRDLYKKTGEYKKNNDKHKSDSKSFKEFEEKYNSSKIKYEFMEDNFRKGQAGLLAKDLKEGSQCPVCGATHHPKRAQIFGDVPTEKELKQAKADYDNLREDREIKLNNLANLNGIIKKSKEELLDKKEKLKPYLSEQIEEEEQLLKYLTAKGKKIGEDLENLKKQQAELIKLIHKKKSIEDSIVSRKEQIKNKEDSMENLEKEYTEYYGKVESEEKLLINAEKEISQEIRTVTKLTARIKEQQIALAKLENDFKRAQESYSKAQTEQASLKADKEGKSKNVNEVVEEVKVWQEQLNNKIKGADFEDYNQYVLFRMTEEEIKLLEKDILEYHQNLKSLKDRVENAIKDTEGLKEVSIENLTKSLNELKQGEQHLEKREKDIFSRINNNNKVLKELEAISEAIREEEEKYSVIGDLAKIATGDNREKITFERYVLAAYFDEIITAANIRLNKMAGGRFVLKRKEEKGKGSKQEGLELEVFDNYTGKARHVKTLSGGESFKASLALALGLADVVQCYAGGISLDTMFVDEGFGTLDPESLDNAIQCLIDLQKGGRLVGIISHVPELKERIDARLEISTAKEGSKAKFVF